MHAEERTRVGARLPDARGERVLRLLVAATPTAFGPPLSIGGWNPQRQR